MINTYLIEVWFLPPARNCCPETQTITVKIMNAIIVQEFHVCSLRTLKRNYKQTKVLIHHRWNFFNTPMIFICTEPSSFFNLSEIIFFYHLCLVWYTFTFYFHLSSIFGLEKLFSGRPAYYFELSFSRGMSLFKRKNESDELYFLIALFAVIGWSTSDLKQ